jgi:hypothetical protein
MRVRDRVRGLLLALACSVAAALVAFPTAAPALTPAPTITRPKPSAVVTSTVLVKGRVGILATDLRVTGATLTSFTIAPADSEGATFTAEVTVPEGTTVIGVEAWDGASWSEAATRTVWNLGSIPQDRRLVLVDKSDYMLYVLRFHMVIATYPIAIGMSGTPTPSGWRYLARPSKSPSAVWGPFRMRLFRKAWVRVTHYSLVDGRRVRHTHPVLKFVATSYYIHGTNDPDSIGTPASHGCIRMWNKDLRVFRGLTYRRMLTIIRF